MNYKRRDFLQMSGSIAAALAIAPFGRALLLNNEATEATKKQKIYGLQLYSIRDDMAKDPKGVLKQIASFGYKQVETFEGPMGMFWGMSNTDFKKYLDDLGMTIIASHCNIDKDFDKKAAEAATIGMKYLICPSRGSGKTVDDFNRIADDFNLKGEICKKNGIRFGYHNHEYSFKEMDGQFPQDIMMKNTDAALVDFEMDIYWVVTGRQDPVTWLKKYPNRFRLGHIKDRIKNATERDASCTLGEGSIDYSKIVKTAGENGMQYFIVEQERYDNSTPLKCAESDSGYMKKLKI